MNRNLKYFTAEEYYAIKKFSCSGAKRILKNPREYYLWEQGLMETSSYEQDVGTVFHYGMLEPEKVNDIYEIREPLSDGLKKYLPYFKSGKYENFGKDVHRNSKEYKALRKDTSKDIAILMPSEIEILDLYSKSDKIFLTQEDVDQINRMIIKTKKLPIVEEYLSTGQKEVTLFGEIDSVEYKVRIDLLKERPNGHVSLLDLKTTFRDATPASFVKESGNSDWYIQDALYREIARQNYEGVDDFTFVMTSKEEWSGAGFFQHEQIDIDTGVEKIKLATSKYKKCLELGYFPESKFEPESEKFQTVSICKLPTYIWYKYLD